MKAMLLAAGKGERMRPLTLKHPKPLLQVAGKPLIEHHLERLVRIGVRDVVVNVSWLAEQIVQQCGDGRRFGCRIHYSHEDTPLETAGGIIQALPLLGDEPFVLLNADVWTDYPLADLANRSLSAAAAHLVLVDNPAHHLAGDFSLHGEHVVVAARDTLTYAGLGLYHPQFFAGCEPGKRALLPLLQRGITQQRLCGEHYRGRWTDVGTPERLEEINRTRHE